MLNDSIGNTCIVKSLAVLIKLLNGTSLGDDATTMGTQLDTLAVRPNSSSGGHWWPSG